LEEINPPLKFPAQPSLLFQMNISVSGVSALKNQPSEDQKVELVSYSLINAAGSSATA